MKKYYVAITFTCDSTDQGEAALSGLKKHLAEAEAAGQIHSSTVRDYEEEQGIFEMPHDPANRSLEEYPVGLSCDDVFVPTHPMPDRP